VFLINPMLEHAPAARRHLLQALSQSGRAAVEALLAQCPVHRATPLHHLSGLALSLGMAAISVKDEGQRFGLKSFKALGGAYAVMRLVLDHASALAGAPVDPRDLLSDRVRAVAAQMTITCATDGNHGRSVAAGAKLMGALCVIFVHGGVSADRVAAMAAFGAKIVKVDGTYDDSVAEAARQAKVHGWTVVSDTSWEGYEDIPLTVMQGYTVMAGEAFDALAEAPTHLFLQAGVGGMAAAVAAYAQAVYGNAAPRIIIVEPARAACLFASAKAGKVTEVPHSEPTVMGMLECYAPSPIAFEILAPITSGYVTLEEDEAVAAMKRLAFPETGDPAIIAGESGGTGLAGLIACLNDASIRKTLNLSTTSRVLLFNSEGATDPGMYERLVGVTPDTVLSSRSVCG
jgi:diaminopropionate ammonia-lyase